MDPWRSRVSSVCKAFIHIYSILFNAGLPFDEALYKSEKKVEDGEILTLLKQSTNPRANKKKKKAAEKAVTEETKNVDEAPMLVESWEGFFLLIYR